MTKQEIKGRIKQLTDLIENSNRVGKAAYRKVDWKNERAFLRWKLRNKKV